MEERYLYRYERGYISHGDLGYHNAHLDLIKHKIVKETAKGVRLGNGRFVLNDAKKRYAYPTPEQALHNFVKRTQTCCGIQESQLDKSKTFLMAAKAHNPSLEDINEFHHSSF